MLNSESLLPTDWMDISTDFNIVSDYPENNSVFLLSTVDPKAADNLPSLAVRDETLARAEVAVQVSIFVMAIVGNGLVLGLLAAISRRKELSRMYTMIGHLSCADLFVALFNLLPQLIWDITYRFAGGRALCKLVKYGQVAVLYASSFVLVATAVDRYTAICHPMLSHAWTSAAARRLVAVAWIAALVLAIPQFIIFDQVELDPPGSGVHDCWEHFDPRWTLPLYVTWFAVVVYFAPLAILGVIYARICVVVWRSAAVSAAATAPPPRSSTTSENRRRISVGDERLECVGADPVGRRSTASRATRNSSGLDRGQLAAQLSMSRAKAKTVKLTLTVIASYVLCWGPFFVAQLWSAWDPLAPFEGHAMVIILLLASLNSCTNPWIYMAFSDHLRRRLRWICCGCCGSWCPTRRHELQPLRQMQSLDGTGGGRRTMD